MRPTEAKQGRWQTDPLGRISTDGSEDTIAYELHDSCNKQSRMMSGRRKLVAT